MKVTAYTSDADRTLCQEQLYPIPGEMTGLPCITIFPKDTKQEMLGFGIALTGASCYLLSKMDSKMRKELLSNTFSHEGANLSIGRISAGSCDYSLSVYSYDDVPFDMDLHHFSIQKDEEFILPMLREIDCLRDDMYWFSSIWSPPGWMKTGESMFGGFLRSEFTECYVDYYWRFLEAYYEKGIAIQALTIQNEPETDQGSRMPACILHPEMEMTIAKSLKKRIQEKHRNIAVWILDHNYNMWNRAHWMLSDPETNKAADGVAFHYYDGTANMMSCLHDLHPDKPFHLTEGGPDLGENYLTDHAKWGIVFTNAINNWCSSITSWNYVLDEYGNPNTGYFSCAGLVTYDRTNNTLLYSGQYKAISHFSKFIQRGARRIQVSLPSTSLLAWGITLSKLQACAFLNPDNTIVLVVTNPEQKQHAQIQIYGQLYRVQFAGNSITTIVIKP